MEFTAEMIAQFLGGEVVGNPEAKVSTVVKIEEGVPGGLAFLSNPKYEHYLYETKASIVIVNRSFEPAQHVEATLVKVEDAYACFAKLLELYIANKPQKEGVSSLAFIDSSTQLAEDAYVGEFAVIGSDVKIGKNAKIYPQVFIGDRVKIGDHVTIYPGARILEESVLGNHVTIHPGAVIGADGFGFAPNADGEYDKIPQIGNVILEDYVDIGANTCIDRATMGSTVIRRGAKLDNQIQIWHNASVGRNTVAAAQLGLAGSSKIGDNCMIGGQVGISGHLKIGDNVKIASKSGISNNIPDDGVVMGNPSMPGTQFHRSFAIYRNLPDLSRKVSTLEKEITRLGSLLAEINGSEKK